MPFDKEPVVKEIENKETQSDFDMDAATAEISDGLFGQGSDEDDKSKEKTAEGEKAEASSEPAKAAVEEKPSPQLDDKGKAVEGEVVEENTAEVQAVGAPKTWTKEALETWATVPPRAQQEILKREEDFLKGITQYKELATVGNGFNQVLEPYRPILAAENIDPMQLVQSFAANHYLLTRGTPQQKIELAASMLTGYGIDLAGLLNFIADGDEVETVSPAYTALEQRFKTLEDSIKLRSTAEQTQTQQRISAEIDAFAADPAHLYFNDVAAEIQQLFAAGLAKDLNEAYEKAIYANPVTRAKEIDRLTAERTSFAQTEEQKRKDKKSRSQADHVTLTPKSRDGTVPVGSIDDTLEETMAAIQSRG